jgi:hypothetical protein
MAIDYTDDKIFTMFDDIVNFNVSCVSEDLSEHLLVHLPKDIMKMLKNRMTVNTVRGLIRSIDCEIDDTFIS